MIVHCERKIHLYDKSKKNQCPKCKAIFNKKWADKNRERVRMLHKEWRIKNPEKVKASSANRIINNLETYAKYEAVRREELKKRTPSWLSKNQTIQIRKYYYTSRYLSAIIGTQVDVDHIVPIRSKKVSGLHVPWNLQFLPHSKNIEKGNTYES